VEIPSVGVFNTVEPQPESGITVNFPGIKAATVQYYTNVCGWQTVGEYNDTCNFAIPEEYKATWGATTVRVVKAGMYHTFTLNSLDNNIVLDVPIKTITVVGIAAECSLAIVQNDWVYPYANASVGVANEFLVFGNGKTYEVRLWKTGFYPINAPGINAGDTVNFSECFYEATVPVGLTDTQMESNNWIQPMPANAGDKFTLLCDRFGGAREAQMTFVYGGITHTVNFLLDGTDPFKDYNPGAGLLEVATAIVEHYSGPTNKLTITVTKIAADGTKEVFSDSFIIDNNAAGAYTIGPYKVYVATKGNTQIRECYIVR
jgi:hypothetical protein